MAFGVPGSEPTQTGPFLGRIQYDARVGFWKIVKRVQDDAGDWSNEEGEPFRKPTMTMDMGSLEVGYIKLTGTPSFMLAPYGKPIPGRPEETMLDAKGKPRLAFLPGFRVKVAGEGLFEDAEIYYLSGNSKAIMNAMEELYLEFETKPEAKKGLIPVVAALTNKTIEVTNKQGTSKFFAPVFSIVSWAERWPEFGDRTVPPPGTKAKVLEAAGGGELDDEIPFGKCWQ